MIDPGGENTSSQEGVGGGLSARKSEYATSLDRDDMMMDLDNIFVRPPLSFRYDWPDVMLSTMAHRGFAGKLLQYISQLTQGYP